MIKPYIRNKACSAGRIYGNAFTPDQMKWLVDYQMVRGINLFVFGNIKEDKEICNIADNRIFRLYETDASGVPLHYFERIVEELLPDLDAFKQEEEILKKFVQELDASRNLKAK